MGRQLRLKLDRPVAFRAGDFVTAASNRAAVAALTGFPNEAEVRAALVGPEGCGKTHLAEAWADRVGAVRLTPAAAANADLAALEGRPVLLDDADQASDEIRFHLYNLAGAPGGALLLASRLRPVKWTSTLPDLRSRLGALRVIEIAEPEDAVLRGVLRQNFERRGIRPPEDLLDYLVLRMERSASAARRVVEELDETAAAERRPLNRALARQVLEETSDLFD